MTVEKLDLGGGGSVDTRLARFCPKLACMYFSGMEARSTRHVGEDTRTRVPWERKRPGDLLPCGPSSRTTMT